MHQHSEELVLGNRISWSFYEKMCKIQGLENRKRKHSDSKQTPTTAKKKKHGYTMTHFNELVNTEELLSEAQQWSHNETVNWSQLATKYGLTVPNRGQIVKEHLQELGIPAAMKPAPKQVHRRAKAKFKGGRISFPMYKPASTEKKIVRRKIESGEINTGKPIVPTQHHSFRIQYQTLVSTTVSTSAQQICLTDLRTKLLS